MYNEVCLLDWFFSNDKSDQSDKKWIDIPKKVFLSTVKYVAHELKYFLVK